MRSKRIAAWIFLSAAIFFPLCANADWEFAGWYGGGCYPNITLDPKDPNVIYLTSDVAGVWKSIDRGENWKVANKGLGRLDVSIIEISPSDSQRLYAGTRLGLYLSTNGAESWSLEEGKARNFSFSRPESYRSIVFSPNHPASLAVGTSKGEVWLSDNHGVSWWKAGAPFPAPAVITAMVWLTGVDELLVASPEGLARFRLTAKQWVMNADSPKNITDLALSADGSKIYAAGDKYMNVSTNSGTTWEKTGRAPRGHFFRLWPTAGALYAAWNDGWKGGITKSEDEGKSWKEVKGKLTADVEGNPTRQWAGSHGRINAFKQSPHEPHVWWRTDWWGVWKSETNAVDWTEKIRGAANTVVSDVLVAKNGDVYVATMDNGLLMSVDEGRTYQTVFPKKYEDDEAGHVWKLAQNSDGDILATSSPWNRNYDQVVEIKNGTATKIHRQGLPAKRSKKNTVWNSGYARAITFHPTDAQTVYLGMDGDDVGGFFISKDGGRSWTQPRGQPASRKIYNGLAVHKSRPNRILWGACGTRGGVYLSEDGGESWTYAQRRMKRVFDIAYTGDGYAWAAGDMNGPAIFVSEDGGQRWKLAKHFGGDGAAESLCALPDGRLMVGIVRWNALPSGGLYVSSSDRKQWLRMDADLPEGDAPAALALDERKNLLYVARYAGSVYKKKLIAGPTA